jgi:hypothetical protein
MIQLKFIVMAAIVPALFLPYLRISPTAQMLSDANENQREAKNQPPVRRKAWEPFYFEEINKRVKLAKLDDLRKIILPKDDLELRVWIGFGAIPLEGIIIKKRDGQWSAIHLRSRNPRLSHLNYNQTLSPPKSGWDTFWHSLVEKGTLTLPDSSELKDKKLAFDGESFVVEINKEGSYRTYLYENPAIQKWPEAKKVINIVQGILDEFNIQRVLVKASD